MRSPLSIKVGCFVVGLLFCISATAIDCSQIRKPIETAICADKELLQLDTDLNDAYRLMQGMTSDSKQLLLLRQEQFEWLKRRDRVNPQRSDEIKSKYRERITDLMTISIPVQKEFMMKGPYDYVRDPAPRLNLGNGYAPEDPATENYATARDPEVCEQYLENLRYFARRGMPLSCGQPVAPSLKTDIQPVEWEDLDPVNYSKLFRIIVMKNIGQKPLKEDDIVWYSQQVKKRIYVFRRAKLALSGYPTSNDHETVPSVPVAVQIIQFGPEITDENNPNWANRCYPQRGRRMSYDRQGALHVFVVTDDLRHVYYELGDWNSGGQVLWLIKKRVYGEVYLENGDVRLSQLDLDKALNSTPALSPVCLYHIKDHTNGNKQ